MHLITSIRRYIKNTEMSIIIISALCSTLGLALIFSATQTHSSYRNVIVQAGATIIGIFFMIIISNIDYEIYDRFSKFIILFSVTALFITFFVAEPVKGNRNWIDFGILRMQTSEFTKIAFILTFSAHISRIHEDINMPRNVVMLTLHLFAYLIPIFLQGDVGSALVYVCIFILVLFVGGFSIKYLIGSAVLMGALAPLIWNFLLDNNKKGRILVTFNPQLDPLGYGYQPLQSQMAIGSGRLWGSGLMNGIQTQYGLLPEKHTDFIFSVAGEELGFMGALTIIILLMLLMYRIVKVAISSKDKFGMLICMGVFSMIFFQSIENIGMCIGLLPVIGITLPLFSYGGSSALSVYMALGLVLAVKIRSNTFNLNLD